MVSWDFRIRIIHYMFIFEHSMCAFELKKISSFIFLLRYFGTVILTKNPLDISINNDIIY